MLGLVVLPAVALAGLAGQDFFHPAFLLPLLLPLLLGKRFPLLACWGVFLFLFGVYAHWRQQPPPWPAMDCVAEAHLIDFPQPADPLGWRFPVRLQASDCDLAPGSRLLLTDYQSHHVYDLGAAYRFRLRLKEHSPYASAQRLEALPQSAAPFYLRWRAAAARRLEALFPEHQRWARALILGDRSLLQSWDWRDLQRTGTAHLVAVSGLHLALFSWLSYRFFLLLALPLRWWLRPRSLALSGAAAAGFLYVVLTGAAPPVIRAALLLLCLAVHWFWPRLQSGLQALLLAALLQLIWQPATALQASAWLSYVAVAGLLLWHERCRNWPRSLQYLSQNFMLSLLLAPLAWALFGGISWIAPLLNLLLVSWLPMLLLSLVAAMLFALLATPVAELMQHYFTAIAQVSAWPGAYTEFLWQPRWLTALAMSALLLLAMGKLPRKRFYMAFLLLLMLFNSLRPALTDRLLNHRFPVALIRQGSDFYIINGGTRRNDERRNDFKRHLRPILRQHGQRPRALILSTDAVSAHSSIVSIVQDYPNIPIYSLVPQPKNFPFKVKVCPAENEDALIFERQGSACRLRLSHFLIEERQIHRLLP